MNRMRNTDNTKRPGDGPRYRPEPWPQSGEFPAPPWAGGKGRGRRGGSGFGQEADLPAPGRGRGDREGFGGPGGHGPRGGHGPHGRGRGGRGRSRGDVRAAILLLLAERPRHGYELIQEITDRSGGLWQPSPGSVYPTLQSLEDEGLITVETVEGRRTASLTAAGVAWVDANRSAIGTPWQAAGDVGPELAIRREILALKDAAAQVVRVGTPAQLTAATTALATARKELYRILADDDPQS